MNFMEKNILHFCINACSNQEQGLGNDDIIEKFCQGLVTDLLASDSFVISKSPRNSLTFLRWLGYFASTDEPTNQLLDQPTNQPMDCQMKTMRLGVASG